MQRRSLCLTLMAIALLAAPPPAQAGFFDSIGDFFTETIPNVAGNVWDTVKEGVTNAAE